MKGNGSSEPMPNIKIIVTGEDKKLEVESDAKGHFSISAEPGAYNVSIDLPQYDCGKMIIQSLWKTKHVSFSTLELSRMDV